MDLLDKLNIPSLPEQQTRLSYPNINDALLKDPNVRLGFDVCCVCAKSLLSVQGVTCKGCKRIDYCSSTCRKIDASPEKNSSSDDHTASLGHSALVCSLLRLCNLDEIIEERKSNSNNETTNKKKLITPARKKTTTKKEEQELEEAEYRVRSEYESYPATLANVLADGPCYKTLFRGTTSTLTIHIIGSQEGAELWADDNNNDFTNSYTDAFAELLEGSSLSTLHLVFVGPNCPRFMERKIRNIQRNEQPSRNNKTAKKKSGCRIVFDICPKHYHEANFGESNDSNAEPYFLPKANAVVFFNPGFTCPDYNWETTTKCISAATTTTSTTALFLIATNTEIEAILDCQFMHKQGLISVLPSWAAATDDDDDDNGEYHSSGASDHDNKLFSVEKSRRSTVFFGENPYSGTRVRQSGNMANDLFVKNRWIFGGPLEFAATSSATCSNTSKLHHTKTSIHNNGINTNPSFAHQKDATDNDTHEQPPVSKKRKTHANKKKNNPALI